MILEQFKLDGKVAIVTGATSGIGQAIAVSLAEAGADVVGVGSSGNFAETEAAVKETGRRFARVKADCTAMSAVPQIIDAARAQFGRLDILVNNAGTIRRAPSLEFTEKDWDDVINLNLKFAFFLSQAAARVFVEQGSGGKIVNIASLLSFQGGILVPSYTASKSGLAGVTKTMANEWASKGINVNAVAPGYIATKNTEPLRNDPVRSKSILERIPAGRWGDPKDIAGMVVFLASEAAAYCHGATFTVDGGWMGR